MKLGNRATLKNIQRKTVDVEVPELDASFRLREMSGTERDRFEAAAFKEEGGKRTIDPLYLRARLVALCLIDESGERMYSDAEITTLSDDLPASILGTLFTAAQKLNGLDAQAVEDAGKNSGSAPGGASTSA